MIVLGRVTAPYGVKGWLKLHPFGDDPGSWRAIRHWWLGSDDKDFSGWRALPLQALRQQGGGWVFKLTGIDDRNQAEALCGNYVGAPRDALPATEEDEYYWADLIGLAVVNEQQDPLGRVTGMIESGAHAGMVGKDSERGAAEKQPQRLLPFVEAVVKNVDLTAGQITVDWQKDW